MLRSYLSKLILISLLCLASFYLGKSRAEIKVIKEQVEVVKYVEKEKAKIYSKPNATRNELIQLLFNNKL